MNNISIAWESEIKDGGPETIIFAIYSVTWAQGTVLMGQTSKCLEDKSISGGGLKCAIQTIR